ncbi:recombinase family protein [Corynebacterium sp. p3-SID1241]|uniref:recombinase family protein n=1 Tax=Corynebacterium sp. p3-SID1241 TaxID=2916102 RepID=UPI0021A6FA0B|nr:recombinase family protein [Corynebacterium sp. p3-SID1241]MCT1428187.1 recombinase family protein [Corynebacterium sp. p3-SID1241]
MANDSGSRGQRVGYIRVSTVEQNNQRQKELLANSGKIDRFFEDKISGRTKTARPGLGECMAYVRDGDELVVSSIDRLARSLADLRGIVDELTNKGVTVTFLHENLAFAKDTSDPRADLMLGILGSFAEFERAIIRERQAEGIALAKKAGKYKGRKPALTPQQVAEIKQRALTGESKAALAREFEVTRPTVYRALKNV